MMKKKSEFWYILIFIGILILTYFFPLTGDDLFWSNTNVSSLVEALRVKGCGVLPGMILFVITKVKILKMLFMAIISTSLVVLMKNAVNKRNITLSFLALFLIFLSEKLVFSQFFVNTTGFTIHLLGSLFLILFMKYFANNSIAPMNKISLIILGFFGGILNPVYSSIIFLSTLIYMLFCKEERYRKKYLILLSGEVIGLILNVFLTRSVYTGFSSNLIHGFTQSVRGVNFLCLLIFAALVLFLSIKVFISEGKIKTLLSIVGVSSILFITLLSKSDVAMYLCYVAYFFGSFYILLHARRNKLFKYKVFTYYLFKFLFIIILSLFGNIQSGSTIFLYLVDIIFILEIYDMWLPRNFLKYIWAIVLACLMGVNIYIYSSVQRKYEEMNRYIKNELECKTLEVNIPLKYNTDYIYKLLPKTSQEFGEYIRYYDIDLYNKNEDRTLEFTK